MIPSSVQAAMQRFDNRLRLREVRGPDPHGRGGRGETILIAVERRNRAGTYERIGTVRPDLLGDGSRLLAKLKASDVWEYGGGEKAADALDEQEERERELRRRARQVELEDMAKEGYDYIARKTGRRVNNAGMPS